MSLAPAVARARKRAKYERWLRSAIGRSTYYNQDSNRCIEKVSCPFFLLRWYEGIKAKTTPVYLTSSIDASSNMILTDLTEFELHNDTYVAFMNVGSKTGVVHSAKQK